MRDRKRILRVGILFFAVIFWRGDSSLWAEGPKAKTGVSDVDIAEASRLLESQGDVVILDVRTPGEFDAAHLEGAINIDVDGPDFRARADELPKEPTYLVHCAAGIPQGRSRRSVAILQELGFESLYHLDGGINAWKASGGKVKRSSAARPKG